MKNKFPIVWQLSVTQFSKKTLVKGVLLLEAPFAYDKKIGNARNLINVFKSYFIRVYANKTILIRMDGHSITTTTDRHGSFSIFIDSLINEIPQIRIPESDFPLRILQTYPIIFQHSESKIDVISDIDDTIIVSHSANFIKRIGTLALKAPHNRKSISPSSSLLNAFEKKGASVFYISKSESNLFGLLTSYIVHNSLPKGSLFLTPYLKLSQLLNSKKGVDYKFNNIRLIMDNNEDKKYILIGDDSQKDIDVYLRIIAAFPNRILKVYIRQTRSKISHSQQQKWEQLESSTVASHYFRNETENEVIKDIEQLLNN
ncbi:MAG: hypothetical protein DSY76_09260 [Bacteroidetes bacterium]|nr:MAG: hypothetical protein DSY76_09260 [Bacteroidota bacterium]